MTRRELLRAAVSGIALWPGLAVLGACAAIGWTTRVRPGDPAWPSQAAWAQLRYDPGGLFFVHHGVGSEDWSGDGSTHWE